MVAPQHHAYNLCSHSQYLSYLKGKRRVWQLDGKAGEVLVPGDHHGFVRDLALVWPTTYVHHPYTQEFPPQRLEDCLQVLVPTIGTYTVYQSWAAASQIALTCHCIIDAKAKN